MTEGAKLCPREAWYAVYTRSRHERIVAEQLDLKRIECFLPLKNVISHWRDRRKSVELPLFPGYVFVHALIRERRVDILKIPGAVQIIESSDGPAAIPEEQIESVKRLVMSRVAFDPYAEVVRGDRVEIVRGPLQGVCGTLVRKKNIDRFVLSVDLIGKAVMCEIDASDLRKVAANC